jgi:ankyrin repeat protein
LKEGDGADLSANSGITVLWLAAGEGRVDVMKLLLKKVTDANNARSGNISALMTALMGGHAKAVRLLLENGTDAHFADGEGVTPLMNAAKNGTMAVLKGARGEQVRKGGQG